MKEYPAWTPSDVYWNSLLPRIHLRLGKKREPVVPQWMYRSLAPAAAALLIIVLSIYIFRFNGNRDLLPTGITDNDIANYIEQETIVNLYVTNGIGTADTIGSDDAIVIYDLLKNENNVASYYEDRAGSLLETVNENEAEKLFALLSDDFKNHK
jgi:hypothetical protein